MQTGTLAFLFGVLLFQFHEVAPTTPWLFTLALIPLPLIPLNRRFALLIAVLLAGYLWTAFVVQQRLADSLNPTLEGEDIQLQGYISSLPEVSSRRSRFLFKVEGLRHQGEEYVAPSMVRLSWYKEAPTLRPGERWQLTVRLKRPRGMMNPGGFDYERWLFTNGIRATGYVRHSSDNRLLDGSARSAPLQSLRYQIKESLERALAGSERGGVIQALAIGDRSGISDEEWSLLLATGTNHLMAISGLHIGLVAGMAFFLMRQLWRLCPACCERLAAPRAAAVVAILAALVYAALAGFSVPTQRAMLMLLMVMGAIFWLRSIQPVRLLLIALGLVLLHDPLVVLSPGFWLSFCAVGLIIYGMAGRIAPSGWWWRWGRVQWVVALGLSPLLLWLFGQAAAVAPLANLLAVPWIGLLVVPLTLVGTLLMSVWSWGGEALVTLAAWLTELIWPLLLFLGETVPSIEAVTAPWWCYALALVSVLWLLAPRGWPLRWLGIFPVIPVLLWQPTPIPSGQARFTLLDVGQGLAAVVETQNHRLVFDTGPRFPSGFNTGDAVVAPFLNHHGHGAVDMLVVSHGDNDHIGGAQALVEEVAVAKVLTSVPQKMSWTPHQRCQRGDDWQWDGVNFAILHPAKPGQTQRGNNDSCVLRVEAGGDAVLLTGDIEWAAEMELVAGSGAALQSDVLIAPHHGSKTSSSRAFIDAVSPRWVLFPLGYRNRYRFPHEVVTARYQQREIERLSTSESGAITFMLGQGELKPSEYRREARRYWHARDM